MAVAALVTVLVGAHCPACIINSICSKCLQMQHALQASPAAFAQPCSSAQCTAGITISICSTILREKSSYT
jgi:hypothetical protein